jgi:hypothetical protein
MTTLRIVFTIALFVSFAMTGFGQAEKLLYPQLIQKDDGNFFRMQVGLCEDYPEESTTIDIIRKDMELLKRTGIRILRISFGWDGIEERKDQYNWLFWDDFVRMAVEEYGVTLIPYICYTPLWNSTGDSITYWRSPPKDYNQFGKFVETLVNRYKPWIKTWEVWNEPDIEWFWLGTAADFAKLLKIGSDAVRRADPKATVVFGGLAHETNFLRTLFRDFGAGKYVDVVNIHNYNETWSGTPNEHVVHYVNLVADIIAQYGNGQPIWMAEVGYSTFRKNGHISDHYRAYYSYEHTPEYQAVHLFRTMTMLRATGKLTAVAWYEIKDLPAGEEVIGDVNNRHLGIAYVDHSPKPAEKALSFFDRLFARPVRSLDKEVIVQRPIGSHSVVHSFEADDGAVILVAWLKTHILGMNATERHGNVQDTRKETITIVVPRKLSGEATQFSELGMGRKFGGARVRGTTTEIKDIALKGGEIFILRLTK